MKKIFLSIAIILVAIACMSCESGLNEKENSPLSQFQENPATVTWHGDTDEWVQNFQSYVEVYSMNNRKDTGAALQYGYRLAVKTIGGEVFTRIDFDGSSSVLSRNSEMILFDPATETVELRMPVEEPESALLKLLSQESAISRINLSLVREESARLALDVTEEVNGKLLIDLPNHLYPQATNETFISRRVSFDTANDTLSEVEIVSALEDGTIVTSTVTPIYEDKDGIPVKVGVVTVIDSKAPELDEGFELEMPIYNSIEELPELSLEAYEALKEAGNVADDQDMVFGNPADPSYTETIYEVYQDLEINNVPDELFRLLLH